MKSTTDKEELGNILNDIMCAKTDNVYFSHICGTGLCNLYLVNGEILTTKEIKQRGYNEADLEDDLIEFVYLDDKTFLQNYGINLSEKQLSDLKEKYINECAESFFENGLYAESADIRSTATELRNPDSIINLITTEKFHLNSRGNMVLILEIPREYIYGDKKEQLFENTEGFQAMSGGSHSDTYNKCIPTKFIKSAIIVEDGEYLVTDNENYRGNAYGIEDLRKRLERYEELYTEEQFRLYDEAEALGLDFSEELENAKARNDLRNEMRNFFAKKSNLTIDEINARCTALGMNFNNEMAQARNEELPIAVDVKENAKNIANTQISRSIQEGQAEVKNNYIEYENPNKSKNIEK